MVKETQPYNNVTLSKRKIFINNFIGGIGWAIGATVGVSLVFTLLGFIAHQINFVPFVGKFVSDVLSYVQVYQFSRH